MTQLCSTKDEGVLYTNYTGVKKEYRGRGIAKALKLISIDAARKAEAQTKITDSVEHGDVSCASFYNNRSRRSVPMLRLKGRENNEG